MSEYGWTLDQCNALTFMRTHLILCKLAKRRKRQNEANRKASRGGGDGSDDSWDDVPLVSDRRSIRQAMGG